MNYIESLSAIWQNNKWLLLSISAASIVALWDIEYAKSNFADDKYLIVAMMVLIHLSYIVLPSMSETQNNTPKQDNIKIRQFYKRITFVETMRIIFFTATLLPASLQISSNYIAKMDSVVKVKPTFPTPPVIDTNLDKNIDRANYYKWSYLQSGNKIKADEEQLKLNELLEQKTDYTSALTKYNKDLTTFPERLEAYELYKAKGGKRWIFDFMNLLFPFVGIVSLQLMNMAASKKNANMKKLVSTHSPQDAPVQDTPMQDDAEKQTQPGDGFRPY